MKETEVVMTLKSLTNLMVQPWPDTQPVVIAPLNCTDSENTASNRTALGNVLWSQFRSDVNVLTQQLTASKHQRWAICFDDSYFFAVAFMAAAHANRHIILPGNYQPAALAELAPHFDAVLHDGVADLSTTDIELFTVDAASLIAMSDSQTTNSPPFTSLLLNTICLTLFTSGSNGTPKAIDKTLALLDAEIEQLDAVWGEKLSNSTITSTVSHQHIYGLLFRVLWPLCSGRAFERLNVIYPEQVIAHANQDTTLISSPALLKRLTEEHMSKPYRAIFSSGGPLSLDAAQHSHNLFEQRPFEVFGSTETGGIGYRQQQDATTPWLLFPAINMMLNAEGCLRLLSPFIDPNNWYQTSDQCACLSERTFMLKGRADRIVKIEEKRISLTEVERRLCELDWIEEAAVLPLEETNRLILAAVITLSENGKKTIDELGKGKFWLTLRQALRQSVEPVGVPRRYRTVDEIPLNSQGKRLVRDLEQLFID
ncbi:AMP-binding protein [Photobacterium indicum]|uniref:AMP-fatty acid ligase n=1 Tax=Photobacterium indicum TaxID=81447 RepID=A0A2T3LD47_9GAMM|nr:AMP-binding protein [Photobacterium indicum]PSV49310.1 AMP-fatty acid ligase [Photobacterium indicum]